MNHDFTTRFLFRFWSKVNKDGPVPERYPELGPCWIWTASLCCGYGQIRYKNTYLRSSRVSYELRYGSFDESLFVCHHCDNRICLNPSHLFLGTQTDNMRDCIQKGRFKFGEDHIHCKLTNVDILEIRRIYAVGNITQRELSLIYKVSQGYVNMIIKGNRR